jgi:hypothetical protein
MGKGEGGERQTEEGRGGRLEGVQECQELAEADPAAAARMMAESMLRDGADLDSPFAHFIASKWQDFVRQAAAAGCVDRSDIRVMVDGEWSKLSDAEKAAFTTPPSFAAARVPTDEASTSSTATAAADEKRDAAVGAAASTSAAADRAPLKPKPDDGTVSTDLRLEAEIIRHELLFCRVRGDAVLDSE